MSELLDIIISAVDDASSVFDSVSSSAQGMADTISGSATDTETAFQEATAEVERLEQELAAIYMGDIEGDAEAVEAELAAAKEEAERLAEALKEAEDNGTGLEESVNGIESLMAFQEVSGYVTQLAEAMWEVTDKAGMVQDSWDRLGLAADGAGIPIDGMKDSVSRLSDETGRAGGDIREAFISMSGAGIESLGTMETLFKGAAAQAYIHGTSVDALANKYTGMAMRSRVAERTLKDTGITVQDLGEAMGMQGATIDEINEKWESLSVDQRANILGTAALMDEGKGANDAYKTSWEGLQAQIDIAKGKLEVLFGKIFLPVVIPILETAGRILDWLGDTISGVMDGPFGTLISVVGSAGGALVLLLAGVTAITTAMPFLTATLWPAVTASWALIAPWLPWIALGAAVVAVIYEIGKAFGWWTDVSSMIDAIWAGINRLWQAFINHPDVQAALKAIGDAFKWIADGIGWAWNALMEFLGVSTGGDFDVVRAIIDGIGAAWDAVTFPIRLIIGLVQYLIGAFQGAGDSLGWLQSIFTGVWSAIWSFFGPIIGQISNLIVGLMGVFKAFLNGQIDLPALIGIALSMLGQTYANIIKYIVRIVTNFASKLFNLAVKAGNNFVKGIINKVRTVQAKIRSILSKVVHVITSAIGAWVTAAKKKASDIVTGVYNTLSNVKGKVESALRNVKDTIVKPFKQAYDEAKSVWDKITNLGKGIGAGYDYLNGQNPDGSWGTSSAAGYEITDNGMTIEQNITLDFKNVPAGMSEDTLISALTSPSVIRAFVDNSAFQSMDAKVKTRLNKKQGRARGV